MSTDLDLLQMSEWQNEIENENIEEEKNPRGTPAKEIIWAAENNRTDIVEKLLQEDRTLVNSADKDGYTPLHRACYNDLSEMVKLLLKNGADVGARTVDDWQPLHSACKWNSVSCAALLLQHGADPNAKSTGGQTPLHIAASQSTSYEVMQLLLLDPFANPKLENSVKETCIVIAKRSFKYFKMLEIADDLFQPIKID